MNSQQEYKKIVYFIGIIAALGGLLFGLDQGFISNSLSTIDQVYHITTAQGEFFSAILAYGGIAGALLSGLFARFIGRKKSLVFAGFLFISMSLLSAFLPPFKILTIARFLIGFAVGVASFVVPLYLSETAPAKIRGAMGTLFQFMITIGIFLISVSNVILVNIISDETIRLPWMFLVIAIFAGLMFFGSFILPESPRWLMLVDKKEKAIDVLSKTLSSQEEINEEITNIEKTLGENNNALGAVLNGKFIKVLLVGCLIMMFQQLVGINMMIYYAPTILGYAGIKGTLGMMIVPTVNMLFTIPAIWLMDKWGRKKLLYVGAILMFITMVAAGLAFASINGINPSSIGSFPKGVLLTSIIVYIFGFAFSWGPVAWILCSELFPLKGREVGITITTMINWTFAGLVMQYSLTFMHTFGNASIFYVYAIFCVLACVFLKLFVPETKGVTLEKIENNLMAGKKLRDISK